MIFVRLFRAVTQADSRQFFILVERIQSQVSPCWTLGNKVTLGWVLFQALRISSADILLTRSRSSRLGSDTLCYVMLCRVVLVYNISCLHFYPEDGSRKVLRNVGILT
jgi:hypothetical protein